MTETFKKGMEATLGAPGIKFVQYEVENPGTEGATIGADEIGLSTIFWLGANSLQLDAAVAIELAVGIGTYNAGKGDANYATISSHELGTAKAIALGTIEVAAIGM